MMICGLCSTCWWSSWLVSCLGGRSRTRLVVHSDDKANCFDLKAVDYNAHVCLLGASGEAEGDV